MGQIVSRAAMGLAIEKARSTAVGSRHRPVQPALRSGRLLVNDGGRPGNDRLYLFQRDPGVNTAPYGGIEPSQGNLPLSWAVPAGREFPILLDMATGVGRVRKNCHGADSKTNRSPSAGPSTRRATT